MPPLIAVLDADVLVPIIACDFLLTAFDHGLYEPVVSFTALDEVERTLSDDFPNLTADAVRYLVDAMRDALADHVIDADPSDAPNVTDAAPGYSPVVAIHRRRPESFDHRVVADDNGAFSRSTCSEWLRVGPRGRARTPTPRSSPG